MSKKREIYKHIYLLWLLRMSERLYRKQVNTGYIQDERAIGQNALLYFELWELPFRKQVKMH